MKKQGLFSKDKWIVWFSLPLVLILLIQAAHYRLNTVGSQSLNIEEDEIPKVIDLYLYAEEESLDFLYTRDIRDDEEIMGYVKLHPSGPQIAIEGFRFRGNTSRTLDKKSLRIRFVEEQDMIFGSTRMNLNAMYTDPSMMRDKLSMDMFRTLGQPAPRTQYFNLYINDVYEGLYLHVERIDQDFLRAMGLNPSGTLVQDEFRHNRHQEEIELPSVFAGELDEEVDLVALLQENFNYRGNPQWEALAELVRWERGTSAGDDFARGLAERVDLDNFIDWLALHQITGDIDAYADDYWLYLDHEDPDAKWMFIPWDKDLTFGSVWRAEEGVTNDYFFYRFPIRAPWITNQLIAKTFETPELLAMLYERIDFLIEEVFTPDYMNEQIDTVAMLIQESVERGPGIGRFNRAPQNHFGDLGRFEYHIEALKDYVELSHEYMRSEIHFVEGPPYEFQIDLNEIENTETVFFTDALGWVIAKWEGDPLSDEGRIQLNVELIEGINGVDRRWTIDYDGDPVEGQLTLYYRNDPDVDQNWYMEDVAIGRQWQLKMAGYQGGEWVPYPSYVNPYSNKVRATVRLEGRQQFVLMIEE